MSNAWDTIADPAERLLHLEARVLLNSAVDAILEECSLEHLSMAGSFQRVFSIIRDRLGATAAYIRTIGEDLNIETIACGLPASKIDALDPGCRDTTESVHWVIDELSWYFLPLELGGECIGTFGMALAETTNQSKDLVFDLMKAVAEELDQFFFAIQENRRKQLTIEAIQQALNNTVLVEAIDDAVAVLQASIPVSDLVLLYMDEDMEGRAQIQYIVYFESSKRGDSVENPVARLDALIGQHGTELLEPGNEAFAAFMPQGACTETRLIDGVVKRTLVGKMALRPSVNGKFSLANLELIQIFTEAMRQRLVDFNREKRSLRKHFSPEVTRLLIRTSDYADKWLSPQAHDIGILYADISGFTKMCEQILKDPIRIGNFINGWSLGVVECLYARGGTFDKMVGDCIIGLFGPPFFNESARLIAARTLAAAVDIRKFTRSFFELKENSDISNHPLYSDLGVAIGINYCPAFVGFFGPDQAYTCFSSGINNTARLQGQSKAGQILVMENAKMLADGVHSGLLHAAERVRGIELHADARRISDELEWSWTGPLDVKVKNVREPLRFFRLA